jgi:uncharacterized protein
LSAEDRRTIDQELKALEDKSTDQLVIYTTRSLQGYEIADIGYRLGRFWQIGQKGKNNGVILIVAPTERKVRIEVGRGLEPLLTDLMSKLIIENAIMPAFRRGDFPGGIKAGVRDIRDVLLGEAEAVKERARSAKTRSSPGSGTLALTILVIFIVMAVSIVWMQSMRTAHPSRVGRDQRLSRRSTGRNASSAWGSGASSWGGWSGGQLGQWWRLLGRRWRFRRWQRLLGKLVGLDHGTHFDDDKERVAEAIASAGRNTSSEIVAVIAADSSALSTTHPVGGAVALASWPFVIGPGGRSSTSISCSSACSPPLSVVLM